MRKEVLRRKQKAGNHASRLAQVQTLFEQGRFLLSRNRPEQAIPPWQKIAELVPEDAAAHFNLGGLFFRQGQWKEALECFQKAVELEPSYAQAWCNMGAVLRRIGSYERALEALTRAVNLEPRYATACANLAECLEAGNRLEEAESYARTAVSLDPDQVVARLVLVKLHYRAKRIEEACQGLQRLLGSTLPPELRSHALKLFGQVLEKKGRAEEAYEAFAESQRLRSSLPESQGIDRTAYPARVQAIHAWVQRRSSSDRVPPPAPRSSAGQREGHPPSPIFIVGFPRSGTTLTEQVLSSHPALTSSDERPLLDGVVNALTPAENPALAWTNAVTQPELIDWPSLRGIYWQRAYHFSSYRPEAGRFIDKLPLNIIHLGLIEHLFPDAPVIVVLRDPRDACLSAFQQDFVTNEAMVHLTSIEGAAGLYREVMGLHLAQRDSLSLPLIEVHYEDLVMRLEETARRILDFLHLPFDPAVLRYYEAARGRHISTPSYEAVTRPVFTSSLGRWRPYSCVLERVREDLAPFIEAFGYEPW